MPTRASKPELQTTKFNKSKHDDESDFHAAKSIPSWIFCLSDRIYSVPKIDALAYSFNTYPEFNFIIIIIIINSRKLLLSLLVYLTQFFETNSSFV